MFSGILLLHKPSGITSSDCLNLIKKRFKIKKIGHAGTLDAFAEGLLIVGIGEATKVLGLFMQQPKVYETVFMLGITTNTLDTNGEVVFKYNDKLPSQHLIEKTLNKFIGQVLQKPPVYSAIKINGNRASDIIRQGLEVKIEERLVNIYQINLLDYTPPYLKLRIYCSKGTYVRSISRDLGKELGCGAHVLSLTRTEISPFKLDNSVKLSDILNFTEIQNVCLTIVESLPFVQKLEISEDESVFLQKGRTLLREGSFNEGIGLAVNKSNAVALVKIEKKETLTEIKPERVINLQ